MSVFSPKNRPSGSTGSWFFSSPGGTQSTAVNHGEGSSRLENPSIDFELEGVFAALKFKKTTMKVCSDAPSVSSFPTQNAKGYTIPLDKRLAADGRGLQEVHINDNFAKLSGMSLMLPWCLSSPFVCDDVTSTSCWFSNCRTDTFILPSYNTRTRRHCILLSRKREKQSRPEHAFNTSF